MHGYWAPLLTKSSWGEVGEGQGGVAGAPGASLERSCHWGMQTLVSAWRTEGRVWAGKAETFIMDHTLTPSDFGQAVASQCTHLCHGDGC